MNSDLPPTALVIGDAMLDRRVEGDMQRVSAEAPCPIVHQREITESLGGAANVARNIVSLGGRARLLSAVGDDYAGQQIGRMLDSEGIPYALLKSNGKVTPTKTRITCGGQQVIRSDEEEDGQAVDDAVIKAIDHAIYEDQSSRVGVIVVSDYNKGTVTPRVAEHLMMRAAGVPLSIMVDCRPESVRQYHGATVLKPNLAEAIEMLDCYGEVHPGLAVDDPVTVTECAVQCLRRYGNFTTVVLTSGSRGCTYYDVVDEKIHDFQPQAQHVYDVCGAGDTTMAGLAVGFMEQRHLSETVRFSMFAAGLAVQEHGVVAVARDDVEEYRYKTTGWAAKLMDERDVVNFVARRRRKNQSVVFTNGCFDLLHAGHIETLRFAKQQGCVLVVAYNDDASLRHFKGENRPLVPESYRGSHLAQLACTDAVFRFDGDVERLIRVIKPDVLVKGAGSAEEGPIPGADWIAGHGGRVELAPFQYGASSSNVGVSAPEQC